MGITGDKQPYNGDPSFVAKSRPAWANWLIVAAVIGGASILVVITGTATWATGVMLVAAFVCLIGAAVSALMGVVKK